ncbi:MAG: acylphosphatase [Thermoproteota archaeon]
MLRAEIVVTGRVQRVGYRDFVQEVARKNRVNGYVENLRDGSVKIVCEGEKNDLDRFINEINVKMDLIEVSEVKVVRTSPATGEFQYFEIKYGPLEEELSERMVAAVKYATGMWSDIKEMKDDIKEMKDDIKEMKGDIKEMKDDIKEMKGDIKEMKGDIKEMKGDIKEMKGDIKEILKKQDETIQEIRALREDLKSYMDKRFEKIEKEIAVIKSRIGLV